MVGLIGNYATTMLRSMARHKLQTGLTIAGLAVGLAAAIAGHAWRIARSHPAVALRSN
ncbi:MAG: hypothetical protein ACFB22_15435 [Rhodothalassiaceae bacterium]